MKNKHGLRNLCLSLTASFLLASCRSGSQDTSIFFYDMTDTFIIALKDQMEKMLNESRLKYRILDGKHSQMTQNEQIVDEIENGTKVIAANLTDRLASPTIMEKARQSDTPVIFFNREPLSTDMRDGIEKYPDIYYVGTSPEHEGLAQAQMAAELFGSPDSLNPLYDRNGDGIIQVVLFKGELGHQDTELRSKNCLEGLTSLGYHVELLDTEYGNWQRSKAKGEMERVYETYGDKIELVLSNNDDMALGVIDEMVREGVFSEELERQPFPVIGVDGTDVGMESIRKGLLYGTIKNDGHKQADAICRLIRILVAGETIPEDFPYTISENHAIYIQGEPILKAQLDAENSNNM